MHFGVCLCVCLFGGCGCGCACACLFLVACLCTNAFMVVVCCFLVFEHCRSTAMTVSTAGFLLHCRSYGLPVGMLLLTRLAVCPCVYLHVLGSQPHAFIQMTLSFSNCFDRRPCTIGTSSDRCDRCVRCDVLNGGGLVRMGSCSRWCAWTFVCLEIRGRSVKVGCGHRLWTPRSLLSAVVVGLVYAVCWPARRCRLLCIVCVLVQCAGACVVFVTCSVCGGLRWCPEVVTWASCFAVGQHRWSTWWLFWGSRAWFTADRSTPMPVVHVCCWCCLSALVCAVLVCLRSVCWVCLSTERNQRFVQSCGYARTCVVYR